MSRYDPSIGRFITEDPARDGTNWYVYCGNNPVNYEDKTGLYKLYKDNNGNVYAKIESGDTLSGIASSEVNNGNAWKNINYGGDPAKLQVGQYVNITAIYNKAYPKSVALANSLPLTGKPNSKDTLYNPDGSIKQEREYGSNGQPLKDTDYNHGGAGHEFPHEHEWHNGVRGPAIPVNDNSGKNENDTNSTAENIKKAGVVATIGTAIYWLLSELSQIAPVF